ncbi:winged helix-turn-helix domain-containing protein [Streptomyces sp. NBC_01283]|uniref:GntR family transcriptional regulator n=1 Tax=Streptomyces sp. NBC_01283 TaxID=2903812 RepID=UPI00352C1CFB|nr:winged helix-turn-helix domain-containing protein [Streptomyces sp. NBC_01283]
MDWMEWGGGSAPTAKDIAAYYRSRIAAGELEPLAPLPPGRKLAKHLKVALATVQSAYDVLKSEGLADSRPGSGTYVAEATEAGSAQDRAQGFRELQGQLSAVTSQLAELSERVAKLEGDRTDSA